MPADEAPAEAHQPTADDEYDAISVSSSTMGVDDSDGEEWLEDFDGGFWRWNENKSCWIHDDGRILEEEAHFFADESAVDGMVDGMVDDGMVDDSEVEVERDDVPEETGVKAEPVVKMEETGLNLVHEGPLVKVENALVHEESLVKLEDVDDEPLGPLPRAGVKSDSIGSTSVGDADEEPLPAWRDDDDYFTESASDSLTASESASSATDSPPVSSDSKKSGVVCNWKSAGRHFHVEFSIRVKGNPTDRPQRAEFVNGLFLSAHKALADFCDAH